MALQHITFYLSHSRSLFPCGDHMVCIIDDREDVWNYAPNLVHVKPYIFFKNTGDINAPPGSAKVPMPPADAASKTVKMKGKRSKTLHQRNKKYIVVGHRLGR